MFKRTVAAITILAAMLCLAVRADAADTPRYSKDDTWLIYWYICGADDLEGNSHTATRDIAEMQRVNLPPNINVLIYAGGTKEWHHPTISSNGDGMYLYSADGLVKLTDSDAKDMGDPSTLEQFLQYGEENFAADHRILIFWNHGGVNGICYDDKWATRDAEGNIVSKSYLSYDALKITFGNVYGNAPENPPFELVGFDACVTGSYELANSIVDFSRYMTGSEPSSFGWHYTPWLAALANDPSMNGEQIGKTICDNAMKSYDAESKRTNAFSVIDLSKMPELRTAYEAYFNEAFARADEVGFSVAFARAAENRNMDKYSNWYTDLGLLAKNTKSIMPDTSANLLKAIDKAVVYNKRGSYLKGKGISTYYPYTSTENPDESGVSNFEIISEQNSSYFTQKEFYRNLLNLDVSNLQNQVSVERNSNGHLFARLTPEQLENVSSIQCVSFPVNEDGNYKLGGAILFSADDLKIDWKKGTVTEKFRAVEPIFDGHKILMYPTSGGRGHTFYTVPILYNYKSRDLIVRYDTSAKNYEIVGFGSTIENGMVRFDNEELLPGAVITPIYYTLEDNNDTENVIAISADSETGETKYDITEYTDPQTGATFFLKKIMGESFVFTRDSAITVKKINRGSFYYFLTFSAPDGEIAYSEPGVIVVKDGKITGLTSDEFKAILTANAAK